MKIYSSIIIDIESGRVLQEDSFEYRGEVVECKGGSTTTTVTSSGGDVQAQRQLAAVAARQVSIAEDQFALYKKIFQPYDQALAEANKQLIPFNTQLAKQQLQAETTLTPLRTQALTLGLEEAMRDIEQGRDVKDVLRDQQLAELKLTQPISEQFFKTASEGINPEERAAQAAAQTAQQFGLARGQIAREAGRLGLDAGRTAQSLSGSILEEARTSVAQQMLARRQADAESFQRLATAKQAIGSATGLPGTGSLSSATLGATGQVQGQTQLGGYQLQSPINTALQGLQGAAASYASSSAAAPRSTTQTTSSGGGGSLFGSIAGGILGSAAGGIGASIGSNLGNSLFS